MQNFKEGDTIHLFTDYQSENPDTHIGKAKIVEVLERGLPFILEDNFSDFQPVFNTMKIKCEIVESTMYPIGFVKTFQKRYLKQLDSRVGDTNPAPSEGDYSLIDSFLKVDGVEIY